ncbi:hypothetical protein CTA2_6323 [Colletotrichum tanaceti]|uniref:Uncharacterized protein n=1 Tax=Colletotrichum tanaceti TaxID=1306861 RepID=A0A4U6X4S4_9PEZI|nr:hypothetical protein CTA2_6323 [Colletotrichum tanaceti]TKW49943.1 hypothetical protein CTA1_10838 [Colletotrichum tanaceti]
MGAPNPFITNGTCFRGPGQEVAEWFPCGNAVLGDKTCCQGGDMCLSSRACYNGRFGITYLAGCSDPEYRHPSCPDKGVFSDQPWAGLVYCNGTSEEWAACEQAARPTTLTSADACWCPQTSRTVAFTDSSILGNVVQLPTAAGGSVIWQPGHVPVPTQPAAITPTQETDHGPPTDSLQTTSMTTLSTATSAPPPPPPPQPSETGTSSEGGPRAGLTAGTTIGIVLGAAGGSVFLIGVLIYLYFARRRYREKMLYERGLAEMRGTGGAGAGHEESKTDSRKSSAAKNRGPANGLVEPNGNPTRPRSELDSNPVSVSMYGHGYGDYGHYSLRGNGSRPPGPIAELPG